jgi:hypothetical protein
MDRDAAKAFFRELSPVGRGLFLAQLAHELTVVARGYYEAAGQVEGDAQQKGLERLSEIQHRLSAQFRRLLGGAQAGFPDEVMIDVLFDWAESSVIKGGFWAIDRAASLARPDEEETQSKGRTSKVRTPAKAPRA